MRGRGLLRLILGAALVAMLVIAIPLSNGCATPAPEPIPAPTPEPELPANFATYTQEGLFSISYPSDWKPATSIMDELWGENKAWMESEDPSVDLEGMAPLFFGGEEISEGYYPNVSIFTDLRVTGSWTLDEVGEANSRYERENTLGYKELSVYKVTVDGREASIFDTEDNTPGYGRWRYIQLITVKGDFAWLVTCGCEYNDFNDYEDTFISIVKSLRILN